MSLSLDLPQLPGFPPIPTVLADLRACLVVKPRLPLSAWAEANIVLSPEYSNATGPLKLFNWQRGILDAFTDPAVTEIVLMTAVQVIKTLALQCILAYIIAEDPGPILLIEPKEDAAKQFSKRRLTPMARDCPVLRGKLSDSRFDGHNTILGKDFPGGNLLIVSAKTPIDLAQHTIRYELCDEIDKYESDVGKSADGGGEGDPMDLAWKRAITFGSRRRRVMACSPTVEGLSRIGKAYDASDQRKPWVPCPHCGEFQVLRFRDKSGPRVRWDSAVAKELQYLTAQYYCSSCDRPWTESERWSAVQLAEWRAGATFTGVAGFWINHLYLPYTWRPMKDIAKEFLAAKDDRQQLKTFINTVLAEQWKEEGETPDHEVLYSRRESYPHGDEAIVPQRGLFLTAAVDVQENPPRLECEVMAWGRGRECWSMEYRVLQTFAKQADGTPDYTSPLPVSDPALWQKLDQEVLQRSWRHESGNTLSILAMGIDTGMRPKPVYDFARRHTQLSASPTGVKLVASRTVVPTKGTDDPLRIIAGISKEDAARKRQGVRIISIGTHCAKGEIFDSLRAIRPADPTLPCPGYHHFPEYDMNYFLGLCSEVRIVSEDGKVEYEKRRERNEPLDLSVMNRAMAAIVGIDRFGQAQWAQLEQAVAGVPVVTPPVKSSSSSELVGTAGQPVGPTPPAPPKPVPVPAPAPARPAFTPRPTRGGFL